MKPIAERKPNSISSTIVSNMAQQNGQLSPRLLSSRANGSRGGKATAKNHSEEWRRQRAEKAGNSCRDKYGTDFYVHLTALRYNKPGQDGK